MHNSTDEQRLFYEWVKHGEGNGVIKAVAGSGKTTTIIQAAHYMEGRVFFGAFNKGIIQEIKRRVQRIPFEAHITVNTLHSEALRCLRSLYPASLPLEDKYQRIISQALEERRPEVAPLVYSAGKRLRYLIVKLLNIIRQQGLYLSDSDALWLETGRFYNVFDNRSVHTGDAFTIISIAKFLLELGLKEIAFYTDFEDMMYFWTAFKTAEVPEHLKYDWVLLDEAQDTNTSRRNFLKKILKENGRFIAVGDSYQAIYGFSGACPKSIDKIEAEFNCDHTFYLSKSFRCPRTMVERVKDIVPIIESASEYDGQIISHYNSSFRLYDFFMNHEFHPGDAILCRNNQPLIKVYMLLMRRKIKCHLEGSDLAKDLLYIIAKHKSYARDVTKLRLRITDELQTSTTETDLLRAVLELLTFVQTIQEAENVIRNAFRDTKEKDKNTDVTLSTIHKAKGREWDTVYILGRHELMPSSHAEQEWEKSQEYNLIYVAITRAKQTLHEVPIS